MHLVDASAILDKDHLSAVLFAFMYSNPLLKLYYFERKEVAPKGAY